MQSPGTRYRSIDALRGLIMILMAVDHASAYISRQHGAEFWAGAMSYYTDAFPFLTRWITHLCAPGFFFLMGAGVYWSTASTPVRSHAIRRTLWRGVVLFVVAQALESPLIFLSNLQKPAAVRVNTITAPPPLDGTELYWGLIVLSALGLVTMVCALMLWLRPWVWLLISALCVVATNSLLPESGKPGGLLMTILLTPGISQHVIAIYPVIPWLAAAAAGMYFGYWWRKDTDEAGRRVWILGLTLLLIGIAVRATGGWGNIRPPRDSGWIEFLNNVKYPPSLVFLTMALGIDLLLLTLLVRLPEWFKSDRSPLIVFGQTPLFFFILHLYVLLGCGLLFFQEAASLEVAWVMWAVVLVALYPFCLWYRNFKLSKPKESFWRLF